MGFIISDPSTLRTITLLKNTMTDSYLTTMETIDNKNNQTFSADTFIIGRTPDF
jgi:hypothetical protein